VDTETVPMGARCHPSGVLEARIRGGEDLGRNGKSLQTRIVDTVSTLVIDPWLDFQFRKADRRGKLTGELNRVQNFALEYLVSASITDAVLVDVRSTRNAYLANDPDRWAPIVFDLPQTDTAAADPSVIFDESGELRSDVTVIYDNQMTQADVEASLAEFDTSISIKDIPHA